MIWYINSVKRIKKPHQEPKDADTMKAMVLERIVDLDNHSYPLILKEMPDPEIVGGEVLIQVSVRGFATPSWMKSKPAPRRPGCLSSWGIRPWVNYGRGA